MKESGEEDKDEVNREDVSTGGQEREEVATRVVDACGTPSLCQ